MFVRLLSPGKGQSTCSKQSLGLIYESGELNGQMVNEPGLSSLNKPYITFADLEYKFGQSA